MARTLECFKAWLDEGAGGATGWTLEPENHEGWRVVVDEGGHLSDAAPNSTVVAGCVLVI